MDPLWTKNAEHGEEGKKVEEEVQKVQEGDIEGAEEGQREVQVGDKGEIQEED